MVFGERALLGAALLVSLFAGSLARASGELHAERDYFRDQSGRAVFLRGLNVSSDSKVAPFLPLQARDRSGQMDPSLLDPLPRWGFNTIRLLFNWEAYEPEQGHYNEAYLDELTAIADEAWARGLYVIFDMHQDSYSRYLAGGCGEGFPAWTVPARYRHFFAAPSRGCKQWAIDAAFTPDMHHSFREFYADTAGARTAFLVLWDRLALRFSSHPGVIGYDLLNEPWGGERGELAPLYRDVARVIRLRDPGAILFVEPLVFLTTFGMRKSQLPKPDFDNFAYAPHYYDPSASMFNSWSPWRAGITRHAFVGMMGKAQELQAPLFVGEFGQSATMRGARHFSDYQYDEFDAHFISGAQWNYTPSWTPTRHDGWNGEDMSIVDEQGALRASFYPRPYARAIAGEPVSQLESRDGAGELASYELEWRQGATGSESEIYVPAEVLARPDLYEWTYGGQDLSCEPELALSRIRCQGRPQGEMKVQILRRKPASRAGS